MTLEKALFWDGKPPDRETGLSDLQRSYNLKPVEININGHLINLIKVENIDDLLELANEPDEIPFWADIWPSSIGLARYILQNPSDFNNKRLLELGAGVGLAGIAAKLAGSRVVQSDFTGEALRFTQVNCFHNHVAATDLLLADWRRFPTGLEPFERIIGADILYEKTLHSDLLNIFRCSLIADGAILLADPGRSYAGEFIRAAAKTGWRIDRYAEPVIYEERSYNIDIYRLQPGEPDR
jgi:predicted nicotinamide N-methyase